MDRFDIERRFAFHPPKSETIAGNHGAVRRLCGDLARELNSLLPEGREKSLAITHLEETMMWSNAAIARNQPFES